METEFEVKILDIDVEDIKKRLARVGAVKIADRNMRRYVYDAGLDEKTRCGRWIRLRDDGEKIILSVKNIVNKEIDGTKEIGIEVFNFEDTNKLINAMGYSVKAYQENKRISYKLGGVDVEIDSWPKIPTYIEIEGKSVKDVENTVKLLGFEMKDTTSIGVTDVYDKYGLDLNDFKELKFN